MRRRQATLSSEAMTGHLRAPSKLLVTSTLAQCSPSTAPAPALQDGVDPCFPALPLKASPTTTSRSRDFSMRITVLLLAWSCMTASAQQKFFPERIGDLSVKRDPATWSSPEAVVHDLRSKDAAVRLKAMRLVGVNEDFFGTGGTPAEIDLRYTTFGFDDQTAAVIAVEQSSFQYAAVAILRAGTWTRLGVFECWCKYEAPLDDFVHVKPVISGQRLELQIM